MLLDRRLIKLFKDFQKIPRGIHIQDPDKLVPLSLKLDKKLSDALKSKNLWVFFTKRSLKHISEKRQGAEICLQMIYETVRNPDTLRKGKDSRFLVSKTFHVNEKPYPYLVGIEVSKEAIIIITAFIANKTYLRNFEILWRTETLSNGPSIST